MPETLAVQPFDGFCERSRAFGVRHTCLHYSAAQQAVLPGGEGVSPERAGGKKKGKQPVTAVSARDISFRCSCRDGRSFSRIAPAGLHIPD